MERTMQKFDTPTRIAAVLNVPAARIQLIAADRADTTVEVRPTDTTKRRDVKVAEQTTVEYTDGVLRIEALATKNQYFGPSGSIEVTVQLPAGSSVEAEATVAEFRGAGRLGDLNFDAYGGIKIDEAASVRVTAYAGDVTVGRLNGPAEISTQKGNIHVAESVHGTVVLRTQMGDLT